MRQVDRSALVSYSAPEMYALVEDVEAYPEFLPWCTGAQLHEKSAAELTASIGIGLGALNTKFSTRNELDPPRVMTMELLSGPFRFLHGRWEFEPLGDAELGDAGCEARLRVEFEFDSTAQDLLLGPAFEKICNELMDAFVRRANKLYADG